VQIKLEQEDVKKADDLKQFSLYDSSPSVAFDKHRVKQTAVVRIGIHPASQTLYLLELPKLSTARWK
jgi:hypothetical protein